MAYDRDGFRYHPSFIEAPAYAPCYEDPAGYFYMGKQGGRDVGYPIRNHMIAVAKSRSGKGACVIIPNLVRTKCAVFCIDPKGENAKAAWRVHHRDKIRVIDPFSYADIPDEYRARWNPFDELDIDSPRIMEDLYALADGMVMQNDPKAGHWDGGAKTLIAGIMGYILGNAPADVRSLKTLRFFLTSGLETSPEDADLPVEKRRTRSEVLLQKMLADEGCGGLVRTAATMMLETGSEAKHFLSAANENTKWLDSKPMQDCLSNGTFRMSELKEGAKVYIVLPPDLLRTHSRFMRLAVRGGLAGMAKPSRAFPDARCLFVLDEFPALGFMEEIYVASGLMPGYGVHLCVIVQDLGQLQKLYGRDGAETFFANADIQMFFGVGDNTTAEYVSRKMDDITFNELGFDAPSQRTPSAYPIPREPPNMPRLESAEFLHRYIQRANVQVSAPLMMPPGKYSGFINVLTQLSHSMAMADVGNARAIVEIGEKARQTAFTNAQQAYQQQVAADRHGYEMAKADYDYRLKNIQIEFENFKAEVAHAFHLIGRKRLPADQVVGITAVPLGGNVSERAVVFLPQGPCLVEPQPYFLDQVYHDKIRLMDFYHNEFSKDPVWQSLLNESRLKRLEKFPHEATEAERRDNVVGFIDSVDLSGLEVTPDFVIVGGRKFKFATRKDD